MYCCCCCFFVFVFFLLFLIDIQLVNTDMRKLCFVIVPYIFLHCFYSHIHCLLLIFPCVWQQHLRVIQIPTLPTLTHLETLQFHPIRAHHLPQSPFHQVPPSLPFFPSILSTCMHPYYSFSLFISHLLCPLGQSAVSRNALWMLEVFVGLCYCCYGYLGWAVVFIVLLSGLLGGHLEDACTGSAL